MEVKINAKALSDFCFNHVDENTNENFPGVKKAHVEFGWIEFDLENYPKKKANFYNKLKMLKNVNVDFIGDEATLKEPKGQTSQQSSNTELVSYLLSYLGKKKKKKTYIIAGSGCDSPSVWTFTQAVSALERGIDPPSTVATWAKKIIESPETHTVNKLVDFTNKYRNFTILTTNVTRSFELAGLRKDGLIRIVGNEINWLDKQNGEVKIIIGNYRTKKYEKFDMEEVKEPDAILTLGYGFTTQERKYVNYSDAHLVVFDIIDSSNNNLKNRCKIDPVFGHRGSGYMKIIDNLNNIFYPPMIKS